MKQKEITMKEFKQMINEDDIIIKCCVYRLSHLLYKFNPQYYINDKKNNLWGCDIYKLKFNGNTIYIISGFYYIVKKIKGNKNTIYLDDNICKLAEYAKLLNFELLEEYDEEVE